jgi:hypothetical protein
MTGWRVTNAQPWPIAALVDTSGRPALSTGGRGRVRNRIADAT